VDYFSISQLELLRHNFVSTFDFLKNSKKLFRKKNNLSRIVECEILKILMKLVNCSESVSIDDLKEAAEDVRISPTQEGVIEALEAVIQPPEKIDGKAVIQKTLQIPSEVTRFEFVTAAIHRFRDPLMLDVLRNLSNSLSKDSKNYFYYEFHYIWFLYFYESKEIDDSDIEKFKDVFYFFQRNGRSIAPAILKLKNNLDKRESEYDIFRSARLVQEAFQWKLPEDFFHGLLTELKESLPVQLTRLVIHERSSGSKNRLSGQEAYEKPLFDFSYDDGKPQSFKGLTSEIIQDALATLDNLNLHYEDVRQRYLHDEKTFYSFGNTQVILWPISEKLFAVLLLAFEDPEFQNHDIQKRHTGLFQKFGPLIQKYYETDYIANRKLAFLIGEAPAMSRLKKQIIRVSGVSYNVLIQGESGSGKELVAKGIHQLSDRSRERFVAVNSAAIPENLLEAELFGYKKGAFTGADQEKTGLIEAAHKGTLFLDEIGELPLNLQAKLLRVLQEKEIRKLGGTNTIPVDIRLIAATNRDLLKLIDEGQFRGDLYYRIADLPVKVPPLSERIEDIPALVRHFFNKYNFKLDDEKELQKIYFHFQEKEWKGNVRELESNIKRLITYYPQFDSNEEDVTNKQLNPGLMGAKDWFEEKMIRSALIEAQWNKVEAAKNLQISRQNLFRLMNKYGIFKE
jgi:transcriptional regulator with AAA-type ATPase domain